MCKVELPVTEMGKSVRKKWGIKRRSHFGLVRFYIPIRNPSGHVHETGI